jgi:hypothetical protein
MTAKNGLLVFAVECSCGWTRSFFEMTEADQQAFNPEFEHYMIPIRKKWDEEEKCQELER